MRLARLTLIMLPGLMACSQPHQPSETLEGKIASTAAPSYVPPQDALVLTLNKDSLAKPFLKDHLFGKFFEDRAEFFVIQHSTSEIFGSPVKTIVLYYLDERHCQSKFVLSNNITNRLIERYGTFSITPLDDVNKELLEAAPIVLREQGRSILNPLFTHYELTWKLQDKVVRLRVKPQPEEEQYVYTEHIPDYGQVFRAVEKANLYF